MRQKTAYPDHVLRSFSGSNSDTVRREFERKKARRRPRRTWIDDVLQ